MNTCRVCSSPLDAPAYDAAAPGMTSLSTLIGVATQVFVCEACGHAQSPDLPDIQAFYDHEYRISLQSDDHDQLYEMQGKVPVFRTERQAELLAGLALKQGAKVLDFGAAKATTLHALCRSRPDLTPHVFDVSQDYRSHWAEWVPMDQQATYQLPVAWHGRFDLITAHFVLEHVADPVPLLADLVQFLAPGGQLFFSVPDPVGNSGDLLVVDHLNHFTASSLQVLVQRAGMRAVHLRQDQFRGAHVVLAERGASAAPIAADTGPVRQLLRNWAAMLTDIGQRLAAPAGPVAIYGAGFYGTMFSGRAQGGLVCFLDRNPHLQGTTHRGLPVLPPEACPPDVVLVVAGLNPAHARTILPPDADWLPADATVIYPQGGAA